MQPSVSIECEGGSCSGNLIPHKVHCTSTDITTDVHGMRMASDSPLAPICKSSKGFKMHFPHHFTQPPLPSSNAAAGLCAKGMWQCSMQLRRRRRATIENHGAPVSPQRTTLAVRLITRRPADTHARNDLCPSAETPTSCVTSCELPDVRQYNFENIPRTTLLAILDGRIEDCDEKDKLE